MGKKEIIKKKFKTLKGHEFQVSYCKVKGRAPGPVLTFIAGQHGMEHSGPNILTKIMNELDPESFSGTLYLCPCANPLALELDYEIYPEAEDISKLDNYYYSIYRHNYCVFNLGRDDGVKTMYNMNRLWNRKNKIGVAGEITDWLWREICVNANVIVDFHSLQAEKPLIYNAAPEANSIARYFGVEAISMYQPEPDKYNFHNLLYQANGTGKYGFCVEFSIQHALKETEYLIGVKGVYNLMKAMGMMKGEIIHDRPVWILPHGGQISVRTASAGHIRYFFSEYDEIKANDKLYEVRDIQTLKLLEYGYSPINGVMGMKSHMPVIKAGEVACHVAQAELVAPAGIPLQKLDKNFFESKNSPATTRTAQTESKVAMLSL